MALPPVVEIDNVPLPVSDNGSTLSVDDGGTVLSVDDAGGSLTVDGTVTVNGTVTANQGTPNTAANRWPVQVTDGVDSAAVAAGSAAVAAGDPALAVGLSPNSPLPAGTNVVGALVANQSVNLTQVGGNAVATGGVNGSQGVGGLAAHGTPSAGNPLLLGVVDTPAGDIRRLIGDSIGRQIMVGAAPNAGPVAGNPVLIGGTDGTNAFSLQVRAANVLTEGILGLVVRNVPTRKSTFTALATGVSVGNLKSMLALFVPNGNTNVLRLQRVAIRNVQIGAVTGVAATFELNRISALTGGISVLPNQMDTVDAALAAGTLCATGGTAVDVNTLDRWLWSTDEWGPGTLDGEQYEHGIQNSRSIWNIGNIPPEQPLTIRPGQGVHIKCATNTTAGTFDIMFVFTQD